MKTYVNRDLCIGCDLCESLCPEVFKLNSSKLSIVKVDEVPKESEPSVIEAQEQCPTDAITIK